MNECVNNTHNILADVVVGPIVDNERFASKHVITDTYRILKCRYSKIVSFSVKETCFVLRKNKCKSNLRFVKPSKYTKYKPNKI